MENTIFEKAQECANTLQKIYSDYEKVVQDEGLRRFLRSMSVQEDSHHQYLEEKFEEMSSRSDLMEEAKKLKEEVGCCPEPKDVTGLSRLDFFSYAMECEKSAMNLYKQLYDKCSTEYEGLSSFFHSLYVEEKRHLSLVQDRYELESLT